MAVLPAHGQEAAPSTIKAANQDGNGGAVALPQVTVVGKSLPTELPRAYKGGQVAKGAQLGLLGNTDVHDAPFNVISYTAQTIADQQARNLADVVANDPSVRMDDPGGSISDDFSIRGFLVPSNDVALNGLYGIAPKWRVPTEILERVEIIKGPTAMLTGASPNGSVGGGINVITKRATDTPVTSITESYQSDSQFETHIDVGRRFGDNNQFGIRANGVFSNGDTAVDSQSDRREVGSIALDYRGDRLRASLDYLKQIDHEDAPNRWMDFATPIIPSAPRSTTNFLPEGYSKQRDGSLLAHVEYDITDNTTVYASVGGERRQGDERVGDPFNAEPNGDFTSSYYNRKAATSVNTAEIGAHTQFDTGPIHHTVSVSGSTYTQKDWLTVVPGDEITSNLYNVVSPPLPATAAGDPPQLSKVMLKSVGVADTLSFAHDRVLLTLGGRYQEVGVRNYDATGATASGYDTNAATPLAGIVFKVTPAVSVYANYIEGLGLGNIAPSTAANQGEVFAPAKSKQYETGVKWEVGNFTTTASVFQITQPGGITDPVTNIYSVSGDERHRGFEWSVFGEVYRGVRLLGGVSYTQALLTNTAGGVDANNVAPGVPRVLANLGGEWDLPWVPGLTFTARAIYTGSQYIDSANTQKLASSTRFDLGARYKTVIASERVTFRASVDNVFNRSYWAGVYSGGDYVYLSSPRTVRLSATVDF
ncbi:TonB-dependent siderophore receptor [Paraburkholderia nemoris]|uniref:TonB-dependent receptor n=1 Tax=Paraburkholderia nemoris TaxID=2793076 RepID=UPI0038B9C2AA